MIDITNKEITDLADLFKIFSDSTRLQILYLLLEDKMCVNDIANNLKMNQSAISHQLKILKDKRLIKSERKGKLIYYSLLDNHVFTIISQALEHNKE